MSKIELEEQFIQIIQSNERMIYKVCLAYTSDKIPLNDLYQDVVCNLWIAYPKFRNESSLSTWLYRIAFNTCITNLRKFKNKPNKIPISLLNEDVAEPENLNEEVREMYRLIQHLPSSERVIILLWLDKKTYQEISDITGFTVCNVATKLKRIKEKLIKMSNL